jgi:prophage regulatory protein
MDGRQVQSQGTTLLREHPLYTAPPVITAAEAAALFHKTARSWRNWDAAGKVPRPIRIGRSTFWRPEEIEAWIAAGCPDRETWELRR